MFLFKQAVLVAMTMVMAVTLVSCAPEFAQQRLASGEVMKMLSASDGDRRLNISSTSACTIGSSVVAVYASEAFGVRAWAGSGFVVGDGRHVLTAFHVMRHGGSWSVSALPCDAHGGRREGTHAEAVAIAWDAVADVALLEIQTSQPWPALALSSASAGDLPPAAPLWLYGAVSFAARGTLAPQRFFGGWDVTVRGEAEPGDSGGAVLDAHHQVVGLAVAKAVRGGEYDFVPVGEALDALRYGQRTFR